MTGSWRARYRTADGTERHKNFKRKVDAQRFLATTETDILRGGWVDPRLSRQTLNKWAERWLAAQTHLKPKTLLGYESLLRTHVLPRFGRTQLGRIRSIDIQEWVADLEADGLSPARIRQAYQVLHAALRAAVADDYIAKNPATGIKLPRQRGREMLFLGAGEVTRLAEAAGPRWGTLIYVLAYGGIRWGEAAALRRSRVDLLRSRLWIAESVAEVSGSLHFGSTKTHQEREVVLPRFLRHKLDEHLASFVGGKPDALVFTAPEGGPLRHSNFRRRVWLPALTEAGFLPGLRIHDLRHTCAALLIQQGAHPKAIQAHLGHGSITVTFDRYGHLFPSEFDKLADRLDAAHHDASQPQSPPGSEAPAVGQ
jgi:integrase